MELKNAAAVCLISLFSATLVVLIARALDLNAASQIEPQLAKIVEELQAIRKSGGIVATAGEDSASLASDNALIVYYFHGARCPTCRAAELNAYETLQSEYAPQLKDGRVVWKVLDFMQDSSAMEMAENFNVATSTIVLVRMKDGEIDSWNRLGRTLALAEDKAGLSAYLQDEIDSMLRPAETTPDSPDDLGAAEIPVPIATSPPIPVPGVEERPNPSRDQTDIRAETETATNGQNDGDGPVVPPAIPIPR